MAAKPAAAATATWWATRVAPSGWAAKPWQPACGPWTAAVSPRCYAIWSATSRSSARPRTWSDGCTRVRTRYRVLAGLAPLVSRAAAADDPVAVDLMERAARDLAALAHAACRQVWSSRIPDALPSRVLRRRLGRGRRASAALRIGARAAHAVGDYPRAAPSARRRRHPAGHGRARDVPGGRRDRARGGRPGLA